MLALHLAYLRLPFHWDEMGQFVPAALDLYREGAWVPRSTSPNVHPPGLMALLAGVWQVTGYSILASRATMLALAALGVLCTFLLAIRLSRGTVGAPAFGAVLLLIASPLFYTQAMMVQLDMPAMTLTALALLLFLNERYSWCALVCTLVVLVKETSVTTPLVFGAWLWVREARKKEALYFAAPGVALLIWLVVLWRSTGNWLGNAEFAEYNFLGALRPDHIVVGLVERAWTLFGSQGHWIGSVALFAGWRALRAKPQGRDWTLAFLVALAQTLLVTLFGGALLERYLLPVLPILYAAFSAGMSVYPAHWRWISRAALIALLVLGWFWNPPYPFPFENNLAMVNFVRLQEDAAAFLEVMPGTRPRVASVWPFTEALERPEMGYVTAPFQTMEASSFALASLGSLNREDYDVLVVYTRVWPLQGVFDRPLVRGMLRRYFDYQPEPGAEAIRNGLGLIPVATYLRQGQRVTIYRK